VKFYHEYDNEDVGEQHITKAFKYRLMWELRFLEEDIERDGGALYYRRGHNVRVAMNDPDLGDQVAIIIAGIDWERW
jgi:hypothetical protein